MTTNRCLGHARAFSVQTTGQGLCSIHYPNVEEDIAFLQMNNGPVNSMNLATIKEMSSAIKLIESNPKTKGLILTSSCRVFSAGLDLSEMHNASSDFLDEFWDAFQELWITLYGTKLATVAAITGECIAGGCIVSLACDTRLLASTASIGLNEAAFGLIPPPWTCDMMVDVIGRKNAEKALSLGTIYTSTEAMRLGLVDRLVFMSPEDDIQTKVEKMHVEAHTEAKLWIKAPGREGAKALVRQRNLSKLATAEQRIHDTELFKLCVLDPNIQDSLGKHLASLSKKRK